MKKTVILLTMLYAALFATAQQNTADSLRSILQKATTDSMRYHACFELYFYYSEVKRDSALFFAEQRLTLAQQNNQKLAEAAALNSKAYQYEKLGNYAAAFQNFLRGLKIVEDPNNEELNGWRASQFPIPGKDRLAIMSVIHQNFSLLMDDTGNSEQQLFHIRKALRIARDINHIDRQVTANFNAGGIYLRMNQLDSALYFSKEANRLAENPNYKGLYRGGNLALMGDIYLKKGDKSQAYKFYREGLRFANLVNNQNSVARLNHRLIQYFLKQSVGDSALRIARKNLQSILFNGNITDNEINNGIAYEDLYLAYRLINQKDSAYKYQGLALAAKDSLYKIRIQNIADFQKLSLKEAMRLENLEKDKIQTQSKIRTYGLLVGLIVLSIIGFILYRNNRQKQKANKVLETTLTNLKSTQSQLIQSEKMASLGELTAGIAHEIQNPLNFVNNFSELNKELIDDLNKELAEGNKQYAEEIAADIKTNSEKINHHGKRAADIVKGMLQHSRSSSGVKEPTDINALCDEYLRLTYHGLRAKDKSFNAEMKTDFDPSLGKINIVSQDIGRVVMNLLTNAFYSVNERANNKQLPTANEPYDPTVTISTKKLGNKIEIRVTDNGSGIPQKVLDKIFQPFFTTKPTGQGTGLGLSLSYDIVKAHGGELKVESTDRDGSVFIINLPF